MNWFRRSDDEGVAEQKAKLDKTRALFDALNARVAKQQEIKASHTAYWPANDGLARLQSQLKMVDDNLVLYAKRLAGTRKKLPDLDSGLAGLNEAYIDMEDHWSALCALVDARKWIAQGLAPNVPATTNPSDFQCQIAVAGIAAAALQQFSDRLDVLEDAVPFIGDRIPPGIDPGKMRTEVAAMHKHMAAVDTILSGETQQLSKSGLANTHSVFVLSKKFDNEIKGFLKTIKDILPDVAISIVASGIDGYKK